MPGSFATRGPRPSPLHLAARLLLAVAAVIAVSNALQSELVQFLVPAFRAVIDALDDQFHVLILDVTERKAHEVLRLRVELARALVMDSHTTNPKPGAWLEVSTTLGTVLQPACTAFITALAWPASRFGERVARMAVCGVLAAVAMLADSSLDLLAYVWDMFIDRFDPGGFYPLQSYHRFAIGGGRFVLGAMAGWAAIVGVQRICAPAHEHPRSPST